MSTKPFRDRAKAFVTSIVNQRMFLVRTSNKHKMWHTDEMRLICENIRNNMPLLQSDHSVAGYLVRNCEKIYSIIPKNDRFKFSEREKQFRLLLSESKEIVQQFSHPQNLVR
jgi:hypothetical protein